MWLPSRHGVAAGVVPVSARVRRALRPAGDRPRGQRGHRGGQVRRTQRPGPVAPPRHAVRRTGRWHRARPRGPRAGVPGRRRHARADGAPSPGPRLPHLPLDHACQRRLHPGGLRPARAAGRDDRAAPGTQGHRRRAQPGRADGPGPRRAPPRPRRRHRDARQPDPGARCRAPAPAARPGPRRAAAPGRPRLGDGRGLHLGECARRSWEATRAPLHREVSFTSVFSRRDGIVDWRSCLDPRARTVEVATSHLGMAFDPAVLDVVASTLARDRARRASDDRPVSPARSSAAPDGSAGWPRAAST